MTTYFSNHYSNLRSPIATPLDNGLRRGQRGALYATLSHFTLSDEAAVVVLPTGSGKTAVLILLAFWLQAKRVLVVTPSRLVRQQIAEEFSSLNVLRSAGVIPSIMPSPSVHEVTGRLEETQDWEQLATFDVVVGTPQSVSPAISQVATPPDGLFDLILVDEAHHSPAKTWNQLLKAFPDARRVLVTATPFRRDKREIEGKFVYVFPLSEAYADGVFGNIEFVPVQEDPAVENDVLIAKATESVFQQDRSAGFAHCIMVRTDTRKRANELLTVYQNNTNLNLRVIHSSNTYKQILETVSDLKDKKLDGVICVNMLGEGFDFPNLKIAAIHIPHKSLSVTLQFIGRFARTNRQNLGNAKFLAIPSEISDELEGLYEEGAVWQNIIPNLLNSQISGEVNTREALRTFSARYAATKEIENMSLYSLQPYHHVRIFEINGDVNLEADIEFSGNSSVVYRQYSKQLSSTIFITEAYSVPKWSTTDLFTQSQYHLTIIYYHRPSKNLFICTSDRVDSMYNDICEQIATGIVMPVPLTKLRKSLSGLSDVQFFNIGMRNRVHNNNTESYRTLTGSSVSKAVRKTDGQIYNQGHSFGKAVENNESITIGLSSSSKIWSNTSSPIPNIIEWCQRLANKISDNNALIPMSELDFLGQAVWVNKIPPGVIAASWNKDVYLKPPRISYVHSNGRQVHCQLLDLDIVVDSDRSDSKQIYIELRGDGLIWPLYYSLEFRNYFSCIDPKQQQVFIEGRFETRPLINFLNSPNIQFYFSDFSSLLGNEHFKSNILDTDSVFHISQIEVVDWKNENVDISREFGVAKSGKRSIHTYIEQMLQDQGYPIIIYDHGTGEMADFIAIRDHQGLIEFSFYHCKGSGGRKPGNRVGDAYEVCGQVVKSIIWTNRFDILIRQIKQRTKNRVTPSRFVKGGISDVEQAIIQAKRQGSSFEIVAVQPGITKSGLTAKMSTIFGSADDFIKHANCSPLRILGSA